MKLLVVMGGLGSGGAEKSLISFLNTLKKYREDVEVDLYVFRPNGIYSSQIPDFCNRIYTPTEGIMMSHKISSPIFWKYFTIKGLLGKINHLAKKVIIKDNKLEELQILWSHWEKFIPSITKEYDVALSYVHGIPNYFVVSKCHARKKYLYIHHEYEKLDTDREFDLDYFLQADGVITVSERCVDSILKKLPELEGKVHSIENISSSDVIQKMAIKYIPKEYDTDYTGLKICSVGRLSSVKRFDRAIETACILCERNIEFKWIIVGDGEQHQMLSDLIKQYNLGNRVLLVGLKMNPYPYIGCADIFVQTSDNEGKSIVLDEAKILGKPIVVTNYLTAKDAVKEGVTGLISDFDPSDIADAIIRLNHTALYNEIIRNLNSVDYSNENEIVKYFDLWEES